MQLTGGTLTKALALHIAAVLPTATGHSINLDDQYAEDITTETIPVVSGSSPVPDGPGLGFDVDEDALARLAAQKPNEIPRHVGVLHLPGGHKVYTPSYPDVPALTGREEGAIRGIGFEIWEDDGSEEFREVHERVAREGCRTFMLGYQAIDGALRANGRDVTFPDGTRLFAGSSGTGAPRDGRDPTERR